MYATDIKSRKNCHPCTFCESAWSLPLKVRILDIDSCQVRVRDMKSLRNGALPRTLFSGGAGWTGLGWTGLGRQMSDQLRVVAGSQARGAETKWYWRTAGLTEWYCTTENQVLAVAPVPLCKPA